MAENKTQPTEARVEDYLDARANPQQRSDCLALMALFERITGQGPKMWGPSIVGHGSCLYTYESGRSGEMPLAGFAIRGRELVLYLDCEGEPQQELLARIGKHKMSKSCFYFKQLSDLDPEALETLVRTSVAQSLKRYG